MITIGKAIQANGQIFPLTMSGSEGNIALIMKVIDNAAKKLSEEE